tara:strand:- start:129 stop:1115 length:987 start_codon:yes stop_codon:yes gene_type:complete
MHNQKISDIGEIELINKLQNFMPNEQTNDDTAELFIEKKKILINTDILVENIHFSNQTTSPFDIGWKSISTNFSDLAASGVKDIIGITIGLGLPENTYLSWVENVYSGIQAALKKYGGVILGGDCSRSSEKFLSITAIGTLSKLRLHRSNAKHGDWIIATGNHGLSRLGLAVLLADKATKNIQLSNSLIETAVRSHRRPKAPLRALKLLRSCKPSDMPWRAAGTDSSDGLFQALKNICVSSKCMAVINENNLPVHSDWPKGLPWNDWCLFGGEDYELILSLPEKWAKKFLKEYPSSRAIGTIKKGPSQVFWTNGEEISNKKIQEFQHF